MFVDLSGGTATQAENAEAKRLRDALGDEKYLEVRDRVFLGRGLVPAEFPPLWQILLSIGIMLAAIYVVLWVAARLYRVGILMYGKRATLPEM